jgi:histidine kinase/DNA gyrase B/HSP90-like ATPase
MKAKVASLTDTTNSWRSHSDAIIVGKDILELLSSSMYIDPMSLYREYIQNAADAIDDARSQGILAETDVGRVFIDHDVTSRTVWIRDNGCGLTRDQFEERLSSFGSSAKRGTKARGFRGVGRLAGLGYCQELVFRSRATGDPMVSEMRWDCRKIKATLRSPGDDLTLQDVVNEAVEIRSVAGAEWPDHFFEVELRGLVRQKNDLLLSPFAISKYLSQVAPVPFCPSFRFAEQIQSALTSHISLGDIDIRINGSDGPVYRPHRNELELQGARYDEFVDVELCSLSSLDGGVGAVGWILHHNYKGAVPTAEIRGLRVRSGNIQVGGNDLFQDLFPESRFNSWCVGEIHTIDDRIVPNGRRDHYEQNIHFNHLTNHITPIARDISSRCRKSSIVRNVVRDFQRREVVVKEKLKAIRQGSIGLKAHRKLLREVEQNMTTMRQATTRELLGEDAKKSMLSAIQSLEKEIKHTSGGRRLAKPLKTMPAARRRAYEQVFALIYECSNNQTNAHLLVERILSKLS